MGGTGTGTGRLKVTHQKPTSMAQVWWVLPGTRITKHHMCHISLPPSPTSIRPQTQQHAQDMIPNTTMWRWEGGEKVRRTRVGMGHHAHPHKRYVFKLHTT